MVSTTRARSSGCCCECTRSLDCSSIDWSNHWKVKLMKLVGDTSSPFLRKGPTGCGYGDQRGLSMSDACPVLAALSAASCFDDIGITRPLSRYRELRHLPRHLLQSHQCCDSCCYSCCSCCSCYSCYSCRSCYLCLKDHSSHQDLRNI